MARWIDQLSFCLARWPGMSCRERKDEEGVRWTSLGWKENWGRAAASAEMSDSAVQSSLPAFRAALALWEQQRRGRDNGQWGQRFCQRPSRKIVNSTIKNL
jgi:hypothetical protein